MLNFYIFFLYCTVGSGGAVGVADLVPMPLAPTLKTTYRRKTTKELPKTKKRTGKTTLKTTQATSAETASNESYYDAYDDVGNDTYYYYPNDNFT